VAESVFEAGGPPTPSPARATPSKASEPQWLGGRRAARSARLSGSNLTRLAIRMDWRIGSNPNCVETPAAVKLASV
jgi:hypothetical protein